MLCIPSSSCENCAEVVKVLHFAWQPIHDYVIPYKDSSAAVQLGVNRDARCAVPHHIRHDTKRGALDDSVFEIAGRTLYRDRMFLFGSCGVCGCIASTGHCTYCAELGDSVSEFAKGHCVAIACCCSSTAFRWSCRPNDVIGCAASSICNRTLMRGFG